MTDGGVDIAFEAVGRPECVAQAVAMVGYAGTAVAIGVPPIPAEVDAGLERHRSLGLRAEGVVADHGRR